MRTDKQTERVGQTQGNKGRKEDVKRLRVAYEKQKDKDKKET